MTSELGPSVTAKLQRQLDDLAAAVVSTRRQVDHMADLLIEIGPGLFGLEPTDYSALHKKLVKLETTLSSMGRTVASAGGRP